MDAREEIAELLDEWIGDDVWLDHLRRVENTLEEITRECGGRRHPLINAALKKISKRIFILEIGGNT